MKINHLFQVYLLQPYCASTIPIKVHKPPPPMKINGEQEYEVEDVFNLRVSNHQFQYLIHWHGYDVNEHT
jgi:hypothetical protein